MKIKDVYVEKRIKKVDLNPVEKIVEKEVQKVVEKLVEVPVTKVIEKEILKTESKEEDGKIEEKILQLEDSLKL